MNDVVDPSRESPLPIALLMLFSQVLTASLINQSCSFVLPDVMLGAGVALLSQSIVTGYDEQSS